MNFRYFILGLLAQQSMSGYDIKRFLQRLDWLISSPSFGSVYPALHALPKDGLATVNVVNGGSKQLRKVYSITEKGRQILQEWIKQPIESGASLKVFLMRLMLASNLSHTELIACLQQRRSQVEVHRAVLEQITEAQVDTAELKKHLAFDFGLAAATAELTWLNRALERLYQREQSGGSSVAISIGRKKRDKILIQERDDLQTQILALEVKLEDKPEQGLGMGSAGVTRWELNRAVLRRLKERAERIEQALTEITEADYGICTECGNAIHPNRLAVLPGTRECIHCARAEEYEESTVLSSVMGSKVYHNQ